MINFIDILTKFKLPLHVLKKRLSRLKANIMLDYIALSFLGEDSCFILLKSEYS